MNRRNIKELRVLLGDTQQKFAKRMRVAQGVVSAWERGEYAPSGVNLLRLANLAANAKAESVAMAFLDASGLKEELVWLIKRER